MTCDTCREKTHRATYINGKWVCPECQGPRRFTSTVNFVKGGGAASDYKPPTGPVVKRSLY